MLAVVLGVGSLGAGCSGGRPPLDVAPVSGAVTVDGAPAQHTTVVFIPIEGTLGFGAATRTDADGKYVLQMPQVVGGLMGQTAKVFDGVPPGKYRVMISRRLHPDGSPMGPDEMPAESPAVETIAPAFSDETMSRLTADVPPEGGTFDWAVKAKSR